MYDVMLFLANRDAQITRFLANLFPHAPLGWALLFFITRAGGSFIVWLLFIALLVVWRRKKEYLHVAYFAVSTALTAALTDLILKNIFARPRPYTSWPVPGSYCPADYSFPSGHAAFSFAAAAVCADLDRKHAALYFAAAVLISYSRLYLYCHYLGDVVAGAAIGYMVARIILFAGKRIRKKWGSPKGKSSK